MDPMRTTSDDDSVKDGVVAGLSFDEEAMENLCWKKRDAAHKLEEEEEEEEEERRIRKKRSPKRTIRRRDASESECALLFFALSSSL